MKTFSRTYFLVYWFLPILILSGEVLSAKGKLMLVKKVKIKNGPVSLHSHHSPDCPGPDCKSNGEVDDKSRLKRNNIPVMNGPPQWQQPQQQQQQFPVPQDNLMSGSQPIPVMDLGHFEPSAAPQMQPQFGGMPMGRSDNGQGMNGPGDQFQNPSGGPPMGNSNNFGGPSGPTGPGGFQQNAVPFGPQPDSNNGFPMNSQPGPGMPQNQNQPRFGEPMEQQGPGFQEGNFNDPSGQNNFQGPQQFNNQQPNNNGFPPNQFQNPNGPQFPQGNNPPDQFGAASFQQQSFNGEPGFPQGDPNNPNNFQQQPQQFPPQNQFPPTEMSNNNAPSFPNQPQQMNPNFNGPPMNIPPMNRDFPAGHPGHPGFPLVAHPPNGNPQQHPLMAPHFQNGPNHQQFPGQPVPINTSYAPRTNAEDSGDSRDSNGGEYNDGYDAEEGETLIQAYHDDEYDEDYKNKWKQGLFKKHKGNVNEDQVVSYVVQIAWKIISSYIFVFVANMLIGFLGKATGLSDSFVETHITLGNEGKHPFGNYGDGGKGGGGPPGPPGVGGSHYGSPGTTGSKKGSYALSNGFYHPASALYQQPTYQYTKGGTDYALHGYDQYQALKYAKKYSKKYAKKSGKYGLRPKPVGPYLPAYQYGLPPGPLAGGWTAGSGGPNGFYKRTGESDELKKKKKEPKDSSGRNGDGISATRSRSNSTETEDSAESDEDEASTSTASAGNETLSITTVPTVETTLVALNETSGEMDKSSTGEESDSAEDDEGNEATTTLLPNAPEDENDLIKTSTTTTTAATPVRNETAEDNGLVLFKTGTRTRSNSRVFSTLKAQ